MTLKTIIEQFPPLSVDELVTGINNFPQYNIAMKKEFLAKLIKHHPLLYVDWGEGSSYYRARYMGNDASPIDHVSKILCPPKEIRSSVELIQMKMRFSTQPAVKTLHLTS
ncbi:hypothetical protein [Klebsiella pneumoniae]|uniref:hypothetical protein n=1 Tax=Klebsiella pneumoniae TaxID=573 RepID=UPI00203D01AF|nr:hypothetical protein [Klebsiella pneumoniae]EIX9304276.1 hypothetical protein [Klebsiella pneumoniae]USB57995.1 hypothetical protein KU668_02230 [Klebsiella pneumoniae]